MEEDDTTEEEVKFRPEKDTTEKDVFEKETPKSPDVDSCFAWLVAFMSFIIYALSGGVCTTGGIIVPELLASFPSTDEASATLVVSMTSAMMNFSALCAGCFCEVFGWRLVSIIGSSMVAVGYISSAFATSITVLYFTYGTLIGVGLAFQFLPCIVIIQRYFDKRRSMATAFVCSGASFGTFLFAVILRSLIDVYAWRGALLIMCGVLLNAVPCAIVFVPLKSMKTSNKSLEEELIRPKKDHIISICSESMKQLYGSLQEVGQSFAKSITDLKDPRLSLIVIAQFLKSLESNVPFIILPMKLLILEYSKWQVATLVAVLGAGDLVGRLLVGIQSVTVHINKILVFAIMMFIAGWLEILTALISDYSWLCVCAFFTTVCTGVLTSSTPPMLVDVAGVEKVTRSFGIMCAAQGTGQLIGVPMQALIYEVSGDINIPFFACSIFPFLAFILMSICFYIHKKSRTTRS